MVAGSRKQKLSGDVEGYAAIQDMALGTISPTSSALREESGRIRALSAS